MSYRIRQVQSFKHIGALNAKIFPDEIYDQHNFGVYWVVYSDDGCPVGFAGLHPLIYTGEPETLFFSRSGVLKKHRKKGIGARLLYCRLQFANRKGYKHVITYTIDNIPSANNLISSGFKLYEPEYRYGGRRGLHWIKDIND